MKKQKQTETDSIQKNCGNVSKMLQETYLQATELLNVLGTCVKML